MTSVLNVFSAWKGLIDQATTNDEKPTPGYLYNEIAKKTFESSSTCEAIQDYLLKRLSTDSAAVKLKTLRVTKYLIDKGNRHFKRDLTRRVDVLRDAASYRGPPDPLRGEAPYRLVREEAHMVINNLFTADVSRDDGPSGMGGGGGNPSDPTVESPVKKPMQGMANPNIVPEKSMLTTMGEKLSTAASAVTAHLPFDLSANKDAPKQHKIDWSDMSNHGLPPGGQSSYQPVVLEPSQHVAGRVEGSWGQMPSRPASSPSVASRKPAASPAASPSAHARVAPQSVTPDESGDYEARIVEEATQAAGVRNVPTREQLNTFVQRCSSLDCWLVAESLEDALSAPAWQSRLKALCYIEALLHATNPDILEYFTEYRDKLQEQLSSAQASVRERAQRVLNVIAPPPAAPASEAAAPAAPAAGTGSIFEAGDIFSGLDQQAPEEPTDQMAALAVSPAAPAPTAAKRVARRRPGATNGAAHAPEPIMDIAPAPAPAPAPQARRTSGRRRQSQPDEPIFDTAPSKPAAKPAPAPGLSEVDLEFLGIGPSKPAAKAAPAPMAPTAPMGMPMGYPAYYPAPYPYAAPMPMPMAYPMAVPPGYAMPPGYVQPGYVQPGAQPNLPQLPTILPPSHGSSLLTSTPSATSGDSAGFGFVNSSSKTGKEVSFDWVKDTVKTQAAGKASS